MTTVGWNAGNVYYIYIVGISTLFFWEFWQPAESASAAVCALVYVPLDSEVYYESNIQSIVSLVQLRHISFRSKVEVPAVAHAPVGRDLMGRRGLGFSRMFTFPMFALFI
jgi:hypothetical protein